MIDKERMKEMMELSVQAQYENMERQVQKDEVWIDALVRQTAAIERIAASLEKLVILQEAATDEDAVEWTNRGT